MGVSSSTLRNWDRSGKVRAVRHPVNGYRLYKIAELERLLTKI
ncbi:MAG: MerR family DNA-binding transcriptional regulator [candidate division Zixibacteria bacterium]|nr:MerR family DNA-binding transcriptional regulator [candidate division Zixibacteria bacterium]